MTIAVYDILEEAQGDAYHALLDFCRHHAVSCSLVVRQADINRDGIVRFQQRTQAHLVSVTSQSEWPGTKLHGHTATVYRYFLSEDLVSLLKSCTRGLYEWSGTRDDGLVLPEDLAIYRRDDSVLLGSIAHEKDAWLELTDLEYRAISALPIKLSKRSAA